MYVQFRAKLLMNNLDCRLPNTGLDLKTFCSLIR